MIGSKELAQRIGSRPFGKRAPRGWKTVGHGGYRTAYLAPDGLVYKVMHGDFVDTETENINRQEVETARLLRKRTKYLWRWDIAIPMVYSYRVASPSGIRREVNVMPYLPSEKKVKCPSYSSWDGEYDSSRCNCRTFGEARCCFGLVYLVLENEFGLVDMWDQNISFNKGITWPIDLGE